MQGKDKKSRWDFLGKKLKKEEDLKEKFGQGKHDQGSKIKSLVKEKEYFEITSLALKDVNVVLELIKLLEDSESEVWENAAYALGRIGKYDLEVPEVLKAGMQQLIKLLKNSNTQVREAAALALSNMASNCLWSNFLEVIEQPLPYLIELLSDPEVEVRKNAVTTIRRIAVCIDECIEDKIGEFELLKPTIPQLSNLLKDPAADIRKDSIETLRAIAHREPEMVKPAISSIIELLKDSKFFIRRSAIITLRYTAENYPGLTRPAVPYLLKLLEDPDPELLEDPDENIYRKAAIALGFIVGDIPKVAKQLVTCLVKFLEQPEPIFRFQVEATKVLGKIGETNSKMVTAMVPVFIKMFKDPDYRVHDSAIETIQLMLKKQPKYYRLMKRLIEIRFLEDFNLARRRIRNSSENREKR